MIGVAWYHVPLDVHNTQPYMALRPAFTGLTFVGKRDAYLNNENESINEDESLLNSDNETSRLGT